MQYKSIVRLIQHFGISTEDERAIARLQKVLKTEFSVSEKGFINVDDVEYWRQEVFEEVEREDFSLRMKFHTWLWEESALLNLVENNNGEVNVLINSLQKVRNNAEFKQFFSPYFAEPFNSLLKSYIAAGNLWSAGTVLSYQDFISEEDHPSAFRSLNAFLDNTLSVFNNVNQQNYYMMRSKVAQWLETEWWMFINNIPDEFYEKKLSIVNAIVNLGVEIQFVFERDAVNTSRQLIQVTGLPLSTHNLIAANHKIYKKKGKSSTKVYIGIAVLIAIIRLMLALG